MFTHVVNIFTYTYICLTYRKTQFLYYISIGVVCVCVHVCIPIYTYTYFSVDDLFIISFCAGGPRGV